VLLINHGSAPFTVARGMRIAQLVIARGRARAAERGCGPRRNAARRSGIRLNRSGRQLSLRRRSILSSIMVPIRFSAMSLLPRKGLLAIAAVVDVALNARERPVSARKLAARHNLPPRHLEPVLQALVHEGIFHGIRGPRGGYELARERRRVTVADILRAAGTVDDAENGNAKNSRILTRSCCPPSRMRSAPSRRAHAAQPRGSDAARRGTARPQLSSASRRCGKRWIRCGAILATRSGQFLIVPIPTPTVHDLDSYGLTPLGDKV
jgi:Rrf2 family protein